VAPDDRFVNGGHAGKDATEEAIRITPSIVDLGCLTVFAKAVTFIDGDPFISENNIVYFVGR
jgi:hypothetical protein